MRRHPDDAGVPVPPVEYSGKKTSRHRRLSDTNDYKPSRTATNVIEVRRPASLFLPTQTSLSCSVESIAIASKLLSQAGVPGG